VVSKVTGNPVLPFHAEASSHWTVNSWTDAGAEPFSTVAMAIGEPLSSPRMQTMRAERARQQLERLQALEARALPSSPGSGRIDRCESLAVLLTVTARRAARLRLRRRWKTLKAITGSVSGDIEKFRQQRQAKLTSDAGWLTIAGLYSDEAGDDGWLRRRQRRRHQRARRRKWARSRSPRRAR
jgi:hypothetical protein